MRRRRNYITPVSVPPSVLTQWMSIEPANLLAFWMLNENGGSTIINRAPSGAGYNGAYTSVSWTQVSAIGEPAATFDGTTSYGNLYTSALAAAFNGAAGTVAIWFKVSGAGVWTDATDRNLFALRSDNNNRVFILKSATSNLLSYRYHAGAVVESVDTTLSSTALCHAAITWDKVADEVKCYLNGVQIGATQTGLGTWAGSLNSATTVVGARIIPIANGFSGGLSNMAIYSKALPATQIAMLNVA